MAQQALSQVGFLVPLKSNLHDVDDSASRVPILEGGNIIGRGNLVVPDKRVSRKHVSLHASSDGTVNLVVEGPNPVCLQCGDSKKKLISGDTFSVVHGDILELIPGNHFFKYTTLDCERYPSSSNTDKGTLAKGKRRHEKETLISKKSRQVLEDEAFARTLQDEHESKSSRRGVPFVDKESDDANVLASCDDVEAIRYFSVPKHKLSSTFRLMRVQGLPAWANSSSISIGDVIEGNPQIAILSNYMVDIDWLLSACPILKKISHVLVIHGESGATVEHLKMSKPTNWILHKPALPISYGTHHSKAMLLVYPRGVRVVVHTANLINVDWNNKSQGLWMQDFPWKDGQKNLKKGCPFENDLVDYLSALKWPELNVNLPSIGGVSINASFFKKFDYSSATVRLIASVPGYHMGPNLNKWGHMKLRNVLKECVFDNIFHGSPLIYQFSSLGSLDEKWLAELLQSMSSGLSDDKSPLGLGKAYIIWPTVEDVRGSLEGYAAGSAIPSPQKNIEKDFLKKYWARWKASHTGRCRAMPHIKTYTRYSGQNLAWFLLTSANLSKAAWGALQKNCSQLMIRSYELGVLFLPSTLEGCRSAFSCTGNGSPSQGGDDSSNDVICGRTKLVTICMQGIRKIDYSSEVITLPVPYELPPQPYTPEDIPWSWDRRYTKKDVYGQVWPRHVQLYVNQDS